MTSINYGEYCAYRLPCGVCVRTNGYCPISGGIDVTLTTESTSTTVNSVEERKEEYENR